MVIIFTTFLFESALGTTARFLILIGGVLALEIGVWGLSNKILPSDRKFNTLRKEGDKMIALIRQLNAAAIVRHQGAEEAKKFQATLDEMHKSVTRMADCAADQK